MGRRVDSDDIENRVREVRIRRGISQQELAEQAGVTRQAVNAIEAGRYTPNTSVAVRLAQALNSRVEDLFWLPGSEVRSRVDYSSEDLRPGERVVLGRVRDRLVAHALKGPRVVTDGFSPSDGIAQDKADVRTFIPPELSDRTIFLLGCDPSLGILSSYVSRNAPDVRLMWLQGGSQEALDALAEGTVHVAGSHLPDGQGPGYNLSQARLALSGTGGLIVTYAGWEQGLIVAAGNPKDIRSIDDLALSGIRFLNREPGSGSRALLDDLLARAGIPGENVQGYADVAGSHMAIARAVASGIADAGVGLRAVAMAFSLDFVPLAEVRFDLVVARDYLPLRAVKVMLEVLHSRALRAELGALPGYSVTNMGTTIADVPAGG